MASPRTDLMHRSTGGIDVTLLWVRSSATLVLEVADRYRNTVAMFEVPPDRARYAFDHPYPFAFEQRPAA
jgi:hypothetical protein